MLPEPLVAIVVAHDSAEVLPDCLAALKREQIPTIVVDNASRDASVRVAREAGARVVENTRNEGYGRANNRGVREAAEASHVLILNPDLILQPGAAAALLAAVQRWPDAGLLAPRIVEPDGRFFYQPRSLLAPYLTNPGAGSHCPRATPARRSSPGPASWPSEIFFSISGGFDPNIFLFYEDDDLCRRVADAGRSLIHVHDAVALHGRGKSSAPERGRVFRTRWHQAWSRAYVSRKYGLPDPSLGMLAVNAPKPRSPPSSRAAPERNATAARRPVPGQRCAGRARSHARASPTRPRDERADHRRGDRPPAQCLSAMRLALALAVVVSARLLRGAPGGGPGRAPPRFALGEHAVNGSSPCPVSRDHEHGSARRPRLRHRP